MRTKRGVSIVEAMLITILLFSFVQLAFREINRVGGIERLRPVNYLRGMVRSGVWESADQSLDLEQHPNRYYRSVTTNGFQIGN